MSQPISILFKFSLITVFAFLKVLPAPAEIPITGGEVRGGYVLDSFGDIEDATVSSFILRTPNGNLASPTTTFDNPRDALAPFLNSSRASVTVNLNGTAFTPNGEVVIFQGIPTVIRGYLDPSSVVGADTLTPSGTVIVDGGTFNLGSTTVSSNGKTYSDSTLNFEVILPESNPDTEPGEIIILPGVDNPPKITPPQEINNQEIERKRAEQIAAAQREQGVLQSRLNELAIQKATAEGKQQTLQDKLNELERQKNISEREKQALTDQLNNYKFQETSIKDDIELLKERIESLNKTKTKAESNNDILKQREQKLLDSINNLAKDKTLENEIQRLEDEMNAFERKVDNVQKTVLFINGMRRAILENGKKGIFTYVLDEVTPEGYKLPDGFSPGDIPINKINRNTPIINFDPINKNRNPTIIKYNPLEKLTKFVEQEVKASNIADWISGASKAIADARLQISEQKADAMDKLSASLKETRSVLKQNQVYIAQIDQKSTALQSEVSTNQNQLSPVSQKIQQVQAQISEKDQEIAQFEQSIQQTQSEIAAAQQKEKQAEVEAKEIKQQQIDTTNTSVIGRSDPMPSNIFPATSMKQ